jgi:aminoglycoside phosphotransferase
MKTNDLKDMLPEMPAEIIERYVWQQNNIGQSSAKVFCLKAENKQPLYLKINENTEELRQEKLRLDWLKNKLPVPEIVFYQEFNQRAFLLVSEISGISAIDKSFEKNISGLIAETVKGLRLIHKIPILNCPFNSKLDRRIEDARNNLLNGLVDEEDFDEERLGKTADELFDELQAKKINNEDLVFTHGDYCLPNIILKDSKVSGFIDLGKAGIADRYQDIALLSRSIKDNFGTGWEEKVFEFYGIEPDWNKIDYYRLLDEFF